VAKKYSEDGTAQTGGEIDEWLYQDHLPAELSQGIFALEVGQTSAVIESGNSLFIIKLREKNDRQQMSYEESADTIKALIKEQKHSQLEAEMESNLLKDANLVIYDRTLRNLIKFQEQ
jgi:parvulin-like peptidyl-prolyl isomerase